MSITAEDALKVLGFFNGFDGPASDHLWWRTDGEYAPITIFVTCNDVFFWGSADCEEITAEDLPALKQACDDANAATIGDHVGTGKQFGYGSIYGPVLWIARKRKERPQGAYYSKHLPGLWPLYDAVGEEKPVELGNPYKPGEYE